MSGRINADAERTDQKGGGSAETLVPIINDLRARIADSDGVIFLTDFDGTLAPIVDTPDEAAALPGIDETLRTLRDSDGTATGVVSGRALDDLYERVGVEDIGYAGNHGIELRYRGEDEVHPDARAAMGSIAEVADTLESRLGDVDGCFVEDKRVTTTVHFRNVVDDEVPTVKDTVRRTVDEQPADLEITSGKAILEIRPEIDWNKGAAVEWLYDRIVPDDEEWTTVYVGDDTTDEDAFETLEDGVTVKVGDEKTAADHRIEGPHQARALADWIADTGPRTDESS